MRYIRGSAVGRAGPLGPEPDPGGFLDADDVAEGEVFDRVLYGHLDAVLLVLVVIAACRDMLPPVGFQRLDDFPAADHFVSPCVLIYSVYTRMRNDASGFIYRVYNYLSASAIWRWSRWPSGGAGRAGAAAARRGRAPPQRLGERGECHIVRGYVMRFAVLATRVLRDS